SRARCTPMSPAVTPRTNTMPAPSASSVRWCMPGPGNVVAPVAVLLLLQRARSEGVGVEGADQRAKAIAIRAGEPGLARALRGGLAGVIAQQPLAIQR